MMRLHANELLPGARIRLTPSGPIRTVVENETYPEDERFRLIETDRGGFFAPHHGRPVTLVGRET